MNLRLRFSFSAVVGDNGRNRICTTTGAGAFPGSVRTVQVPAIKLLLYLSIRETWDDQQYLLISSTLGRLVGAIVVVLGTLRS